MKQRFTRLVLMAACVAMASTLAEAQTTSVSGVVVDADGRSVPGAVVVVKNAGTGSSYETISSATGAFSIPAVTTGTYTVTVSLTGFKTAVVNNVVANVGGPATVNARLEVGSLQDTINVEAKSELLQTQSSAVSTTVDMRQITNLPLTTRAVLDFVTMMAGVSTPGGNRDSTINGLPKSALNITLDGVNVQDNTLKGDRGGDGFFAIVNPRLDATEEVTVSMAGMGAEASGQGGAQVRFVTRGGTNQFRGTAYHYLRKEEFNENTWFNTKNNVAKPALLQNQYGVSVGGPIKIPGLFDGTDRAFFFVNLEQFKQPSDFSRDRTILHPGAQAGSFRYLSGGQLREVNLLQLAAQNGQTSTMDPTTQKLLADIRSATGTTGTVTDLTDPLFQRFSYNLPVESQRRYPTVRLDWDISRKHRATISTNYQDFSDFPDTLNNRDPQFPGFPAFGGQGSERMSVSGSLRSTLGANIVNELRIGGSGAPVKFFEEQNVGMFTGSLANQQGFHMLLSGAPLALTNASPAPNIQSRNASTRLIENTVNWLKGDHSLMFGASYTGLKVWGKNSDLVPQLGFGVVGDDPAQAMFTNTANFPGASGAQITAAQQLYAVLTGRVATITGNGALNAETGKYVYMGETFTESKLKDFGFYIQDNWRARSNLSLNFGIRYEIQTPFEAANDSYSFATINDAWGVSGLRSGCDASNVTRETCNIFQPGSAQGSRPTFNQLKAGVKSYESDLNNIAPSIGFNWQPNASGGLLGMLIGAPGDTVIRGGVARAYFRAGMTDFTTPLGANPGATVPANRDQTQGNLGTLPLLVRDTNRLGAASFPSSPVYPMTDIVTQDTNTFDPQLKGPYSDSWSVGIQRALGRNFAVEARYVGTRSRELWRVFNYNEINFVDNGYLTEFRLAQQNLQANIASGRGNNFRYFGPGTGTSPLPIHLAYFAGMPASQAGDPSRYGAAGFQDNAFLTPMARLNPNPRAAADALDAVAARQANALAAGLPANFLVANPDLLAGGRVTGNGGGTNYHSFQLELRRRYANGFSFNGSYVFANANELAHFGFRKDYLSRPDTGNVGGITQALKGYFSVELPFGKDKRFAGNAGGVLDRIIGGWQLHGAFRVQSGQRIDLGNVRMVGFRKDDVKDMFKLRIDGDPKVSTTKVWMLPQDVIENTVRAFNVNATGYAGTAPTGRYFAPANGPDCIETAYEWYTSVGNVQNVPSATNNPLTNTTGGYGDCGTGSLVVAGPMFKQVDLSLTKLIPIAGRTRLEFRVEALNVFDKANFIPVGGISSNINNFEVTNLTGTNTARVVQFVTRFSW